MTQKGLLVTLVLLALNGAVEPSGDRTCKEFSLPEDTAKAKAFVKELTDQSRPGRPVTVSTTWRAAAAAAGGGSETGEGVRAALVLMKQLQGKMEQMEQMEKSLHNQLETGLNMKMEQLETGLERKLEEMQKKTESLVADLQKKCEKDPTDLQKSIKEIDARLRCDNEGSGMTFTQWGCFKRVDIHKTWAAAGAHCASLGLELASLEGVPTKGELLQLGTDLGLMNTAYSYCMA